MGLAPGSRLGPFEITALIGAGGMGEVYRARDTRLERDVAVKVLSPALAADETAMARFEREARAVAAINHPNILALYDIGRAEASTYVVTELLVGATLRERLSEGPLPLRKAIDYARQLADALAAPHERGIVHRDIKPENLFVTIDGRLKVLDFGLAQVTPLADLGATTPTNVGTAPGTILGTVGYMAPEQVRGQAVDHRADIFACGAVLYELVTGRRAFEGATPADALSAVLTNDPPAMTRHSVTVPPHLERIVQRCLEKSPAERFQSARDLAFALSENLQAPEQARSRTWLQGNWRALAAGGAAIALLYLVGRDLAQRVAATAPATDAPSVRFAIAAGTTWSDAASVSPDGRYMVYTGAPSQATSSSSVGGPGSRPTGFAPISGRFWLRRLDALTAVPLSDTDSAYALFFWSPDSRFLGYRAGNSIVIRELPDGAPRAIADMATAPTGVAWSRDGTLLIAAGDGIHRVPAAGGTPQLVMASQPDREVWRSAPSFLPGGDKFVFSVLGSGVGEHALETRVATMDGREVATIAQGLVGASYADGHLLFGSGGTLYAQPFDLDRLALTGERVQLAAAVTQDWRTGRLAAQASDNGVLVFRGAPRSDVQFMIVNRAGVQIRPVGTPDSFTNFSVSPDEQRVIASRRDPLTGQTSLRLIDVQRGVTSVATDRNDTHDADDPTWAPDGQHIAFRHGPRLVMRPANGGTERTLLDAEAYPDSFSPDGRYVVFGRPRGNLFEQWALDLSSPDSAPIALGAGVTLADEGHVSPNSRWVAYHSNESGTAQVHVVSLPPTGQKWQVSQAGGVQPRWSLDGHELYYLDTEGRVVAVAMRGSDPRAAAAPRPLFATGMIASDSLDQFAVLRDGFLLRLPVSAAAEAAAVEVILNWKPRARK